MSFTLLIIAVTVLVSFAAFQNDRLRNSLLLWPAIMTSPKEFYRFLTAGFVHADTAHLAFNMISFYFFGQLLEQAIGYQYFGLVYLTGIIVSCVPSYFKRRHNPGYRSLGASGGVAAIIFATIYLAPWNKIYIFFAIGMPSIVFAIGYLSYTAYLAKRDMGIINHDAHLWGSIYGLLCMIAIDPTHGAYFIDKLMHPSF